MPPQEPSEPPPPAPSSPPPCPPLQDLILTRPCPPSPLLPPPVQDFELTINIDQLIKEVDRDGSGSIDYDEFRLVLA